jgi:hypothetical protein
VDSRRTSGAGARPAGNERWPRSRGINRGHLYTLLVPGGRLQPRGAQPFGSARDNRVTAAPQMQMETGVSRRRTPKGWPEGASSHMMEAPRPGRRASRGEIRLPKRAIFVVSPRPVSVRGWTVPSELRSRGYPIPTPSSSSCSDPCRRLPALWFLSPFYPSGGHPARGPRRAPELLSRVPDSSHPVACLSRRGAVDHAASRGEGCGRCGHSKSKGGEVR